MARETLDTVGAARATRRTALRIIAAWIILPLFFLATGGSLGWWEAWVYCAILLCPMTLFLVHMIRRDPEFIARRLQLREKERTQRRILVWGYPALIGALVIPGLDHRCGWSAPPLAVVIGALAVALGGYLMVLRVFLENRWAGRTVETYAGQQVISTGPYAIVRHPMYVGAMLMYLATPVALGSWWALLPALLIVPILIARILNEEKVLVENLPGYRAYTQKTHYRLIPGVW